MSFAVQYRNDFRYFDTVDEIVFSYKGSESIISILPTLVKENQKAVLDINTIEDVNTIIPFLNMLKTKHSNFIVKINFINQKDFIPVLKENNIDFFFLNYCTYIDTVYTMKELGAKEVYITEELGFHLKDLQKMREAGLKIRVIPDIVQRNSGTKPTVPAVLGFWIRPEDMKLYSNYVDTFEFYRRDDRLSVVYKIYRDGVWNDRLDMIIQDAEGLDIESNKLGTNFGLIRLNCGKKCMYSQEKCNLCNEFQKVAYKLKETGYAIENKRDKEWRREKTNEPGTDEDIM